MFTLAFWKAAGERIVASFIGAVLAGLGGNVTDVTSLDWGQLVKLGAGAALVSLLKAILAGTSGGGPSLTNSETLTEKVAAVEQPAGYVAGPAAPVEQGTPVDVLPTPETGPGAVQAVVDEALARPVDPLDGPNEDYEPRH